MPVAKVSRHARRLESSELRDLDVDCAQGIDTVHGERQEGADTSTDVEKVVLAKVGDILRRIKFGTVVLVVQDGKVVQIEMAEKIRLR